MVFRVRYSGTVLPEGGTQGRYSGYDIRNGAPEGRTPVTVFQGMILPERRSVNRTPGNGISGYDITGNVS